MSDELEKLRKEIDRADRNLLKAWEERRKVSGKIGKYKKKNGMKVIDRKREKKVIEEKTKFTKIDPKSVKKLYSVIIKDSRGLQC